MIDIGIPYTKIGHGLIRPAVSYRSTLFMTHWDLEFVYISTRSYCIVSAWNGQHAPRPRF